jgi:hypothetical protein
MDLQSSFYKQILKEKFSLTDDIEEIVSKNPKKYCIDTLYNINDLPNNKNQRFVLKSLYQNTFIPLNCVLWTEQNINNITVYKLNNYTTIYIISDGEFSQKQHIFNIVNWISKYSKPKKLDLFIFLTPYNKIIKHKGQILTRNEINSGVCSKYYKWVQIFRSEELLKVLIHELLHYYDLDCNTADWIDDILPIKQPCNSLLLNEAITESMAIILHTYYYSKYTNSAQDFKLLLHKEITYSKKMHDIIINHNNVKTLHDLFNVCHYTNVIPYYIIKYILIEDIEDALKYLFNKNKIKKYIIKKLISYFNNFLYSNYDIKKLNYEISAKMSYLNLI